MTGGTNYRWVAALAAGLVAGTMVAAVLPRLFDEGAVSWLVAAAVAVAVAAVVAVATRAPVADGRHVRDDALPPE